MDDELRQSGNTLDGQAQTLETMRDAFADLTSLAQRFGRALGSALSSAITRGKDLGDVLKSLALRLSSMALTRAIKPLENEIGNAFGGLASGLFSGGVRAFANGGVVGGPSLFSMGGGQLGLMGEAGPEAILPLARGSDGRLGVRSGGGGANVHVTMNITTPDAQSFVASQRQVSSALARAVKRGSRGL